MNKDDNREPTGAGAGVADQAPGKTGGRKYPLKDRIYSMQRLAIESMEGNAQPEQAEFLADVRESARRMNAVFDDVERLQPYLERAIKKDPKYAGRTYREIFDGFPTYALQLYISKNPAETVEGIKNNPILFKGFDAEELDTIVDFIRMLENARKAENRAEQRRRKKEGRAGALKELAGASVLNETFYPAYHGLITDITAFFDSRDAVLDQDGNAVIEADSKTRLIVRGKKELKGEQGISTHKLLMTAIGELTKINHFRKGPENGIIYREIIIPLDEYARLCGYKIDERPTNTKEAAEKEKKRAQNQRKLARRYIRRDCDILGALAIEYTDGKKQKDMRLNLISYEGFDGDLIRICFNLETAVALLSYKTLMQYTNALLGISNNKPNAYRMGFKMAIHYNMDNNITRGVRGRLGVLTLLSYTSLPRYELLKEQKDTRHWGRKIKEPFEKALETLVEHNVISEWYYVKAKGERLTDRELSIIEDSSPEAYEVFAGLYVDFKLVGEVTGQAERLERRAAEKAAAEEKRAEKDAQNAARAARKAAKAAENAAERAQAAIK